MPKVVAPFGMTLLQDDGLRDLGTNTANNSIQQRASNGVTDTERAVLNTVLEKYRPGQSEAVLVGGRNALKPALRLMTSYRLAIDEIKDSQAITSYTRWLLKYAYLRRFTSHFAYVCTLKLHLDSTPVCIRLSHGKSLHSTEQNLDRFSGLGR
jgi:hypothetical protein